MKISIIITAYNVSPWIERCVTGALAQTHKDKEVIVVDDCSTDDTLEKLKQFEGIILMRNKQNVGAGESRYNGISRATGEYVITVDGDDYLRKDFIESLVRKAEETNADVVSGGITLVDKDRRFISETVYGEQIVTGPEQITKFFGEDVVFMNNKIIRRRLFDLAPYCKRRFIEDTQSILKILYYSNATAYVDNPGYAYRQQDKSLCHTASQFKFRLYSALCAKDIVEFFMDKPDEYKGMLSVNLFINKYNQLMGDSNGHEESVLYKEELEEVESFMQCIIAS